MITVTNKFHLFGYFALIMFFINSCAVSTKVQLYAERLPLKQRESLVNLLEKHHYSVVLNDLPIPAGINHSTLIYSPLNQSPQQIEYLVDLIGDTQFGFPQLELTGKGNHFYTKNQVGLYILPSNHLSIERKKPEVSEAQLPYSHAYFGVCGTRDEDVDLNLYEDGSFLLASKSWDDESQVESTVMFPGQWLYSDNKLFLSLNGHEPVSFSPSLRQYRRRRENIREYRLQNNSSALFYDNCVFIYKELLY